MIYLVAGARPNFVKLAPLAHALQSAGHLPFKIVHTGQHYDDNLSGSFFRVLDIPAPDINLEVGSGTQATQTARILERFEELLIALRPKLVVVFGDVTSTLACSLAAAKLCIPVAHVEAGLRSFDRTMPEEINRIVTDSLSDVLYVSEDSGLKNLQHEGVAPEKIQRVGNIMIDSLKRLLPAARKRGAHQRFGLEKGNYALLTMHRPSNVDTAEVLNRLMDVFTDLSRELPILFPVHPRTRARLCAAGFSNDRAGHFHLVESVDYLDSVCLQSHARVVFTDSGGVQEETTSLAVPCVTLRENTERPVTVEMGTSTLVGNDPQRIRDAFRDVVSGRYKQAQPIPLWDGRTAPRIVEHLSAFLK